MRTLILSALGLGLAGCATAPETATDTAKTAPPPVQKIAQCNHAGAEPAEIAYPEGWAERVQAAGSQDSELMGGETDVQPAELMARPQPSYPEAARAQSLEGVCQVLLDVTAGGEARNVMAACSNPAFIEAAESAMRAVRFQPRQVNGEAVPARNVTYPMGFCFQAKPAGAADEAET